MRLGQEERILPSGPAAATLQNRKPKCNAPESRLGRFTWRPALTYPRSSARFLCLRGDWAWSEQYEAGPGQEQNAYAPDNTVNRCYIIDIVSLEFHTWPGPAQSYRIPPAEGHCHGSGVKSPHQLARVPDMGRKVTAEDPSFGCNFSTGSSVLLRAPATLRSGSTECASRQLQSGCLPGTQHQPLNPGCIRLTQSALHDVVSCTRHVSHVCVRQTHENTPLSLPASRTSVALKDSVLVVL